MTLEEVINSGKKALGGEFVKESFKDPEKKGYNAIVGILRNDGLIDNEGRLTTDNQNIVNLAQNSKTLGEPFHNEYLGKALSAYKTNLAGKVDETGVGIVLGEFGDGEEGIGNIYKYLLGREPVENEGLDNELVEAHSISYGAKKRLEEISKDPRKLREIANDTINSEEQRGRESGIADYTIDAAKFVALQNITSYEANIEYTLNQNLQILGAVLTEKGIEAGKGYIESRTGAFEGDVKTDELYEIGKAATQYNILRERAEARGRDEAGAE
jgi:hypothetical protein